MSPELMGWMHGLIGQQALLHKVHPPELQVSITQARQGPAQQQQTG